MTKPTALSPKFAALPPQAIVEFKEIFKRKHRVDLPDDEAAQRALHVFNFVRVLAKKPFASKGGGVVK